VGTARPSVACPRDAARVTVSRAGYIGHTVIKDPSHLAVFEARYAEGAYGALTLPEALAWYAAALAEARAVRPDLGADWRDDLEPDFAIARAVNGLPPA
jgi:hypothetical protein